VPRLLDGHESNVGAVFRSQTSVEKLLLREDSKAIIEQIKLDPLLVETERNGFVVEVAVDHVARLSAVGAETSSRSIGDGHGVLQLAIGVVLGCSWVWGQRSDGGADGGGCLLRSSGGWSTRIGTVTGWAINI